jgi:hypothetical protein
MPENVSISAITCTLNSSETLLRNIQSVNEQVGKHMISPTLSLKRLSFDEAQGQVIYQYGKHSSELEQIIWRLAVPISLSSFLGH